MREMLTELLLLNAQIRPPKITHRISKWIVEKSNIAKNICSKEGAGSSSQPTKSQNIISTK